MKSTLFVSVLAVALSAAALSRQQASQPQVAFAGAGSAENAAGENGRSRRLCRLLAKLAPELQRTGSVGARAQLVASLSAVFGDDPATLGQLATTVDEAAIEHCPIARNELLSILQLTSLREAVR